MWRPILVLSLLFPGTLIAATRFVSTDGSDNGDCLASPCRSVGHAIVRANAGDVIDVAAGRFYFGDVVEKAVVLRGRQAGVDARNRTGADETVLSGNLLLARSSGIVIDGFTFECDSCGVLVSTDGGARIVNNRFLGGMGQVFVYAGGNVATEIRFNEFEGVPLASGQIGLPGKTDGLVILSVGDDRRANVHVDSNRFSGSSHSLVSMSKLTAANEISFTNNELELSADTERGLDLSEVEGIRIAGNTIYGARAAAIRIEKSRSVEIAGNVIRTNITGVLAQDGEGLRIEGNTFFENVRAVAVGANASVHVNRFAGNDVDIEALAPIAVDAKNNWFGCNDGPPQCGALAAGTGTIEASPWLVMGLTASPSRIAPQRSSVLVADLNHNSDGALAPGFPDGTTIQFAATALEYSTGTGSVEPEESATRLGIATTTFTASTTGEWRVFAHLDDQEVEAMVFARQPRRRAVGN